MPLIPQNVVLLHALTTYDYVRPDSARYALYYTLYRRDGDGRDGKLLSAVSSSQRHCPRRYAASTPAPMDCSLLCSLGSESCGIYADLLSLLKELVTGTGAWVYPDASLCPRD